MDPIVDPMVVPPLSSSRRAMVFGVISFALLMTSLDATIVATALHALQQGLGASITWTGWTITAYSLGLVLMLPLSGRLSEQYGRRRVFLASIAVFTMASLGCGLAGDIYTLIVLRIVQAIGGAGITPSATGIIVDNFGSARDKAIGLFGSIYPIGSMVGPILGGVFVTYWSWREIFLVNIPIGAMLIALCIRIIPADTPRAASAPREPLDFSGLGLMGVGLLGVMVGLVYMADTGAASRWLSIGAFGVAFIALTVFVRHINRHAHPIIQPRLIYGRGFGAVNMISTINGGAVFGLMSLVPLYATTSYGISTLGSGTLLIGEGIAVIGFSALASLLLRRTGYRLPMYAGSIIMIAGFAMLAIAPAGLGPYAWLAVAAAIVGVGSGCLNPASRNAGLQLAPREAASMAALRSTGRQIGGIGSISIATAVIAQATLAGAAHALVYAVFAAVVLATLPIVRRVPEHRGSW